jgi:hypothetical protein
MKQKEAVLAAITSVLAEEGAIGLDGSSVSGLLTKSVRSQITTILVTQFEAGEIDMKPAFAAKINGNTPALRAYVSGLISNWVRKDEQLNGGVEYTPKSPGSRKGQGDPALKALRQLFSEATSLEDKDEIQVYINARVAEINSTKVRKVPDMTQLPAELVAKLNL